MTISHVLHLNINESGVRNWEIKDLRSIDIYLTEEMKMLKFVNSVEFKILILGGKYFLNFTSQKDSNQDN